MPLGYASFPLDTKINLKAILNYWLTLIHKNRQDKKRTFKECQRMDKRFIKRTSILIVVCVIYLQEKVLILVHKFQYIGTTALH